EGPPHLRGRLGGADPPADDPELGRHGSGTLGRAAAGRAGLGLELLGAAPVALDRVLPLPALGHRVGGLPPGGRALARGPEAALELLHRLLEVGLDLVGKGALVADVLQDVGVAGLDVLEQLTLEAADVLDRD